MILPRSGLERAVVIASIVLLFFAVPHTLEDFATGEPAKAGIPAPALSLVVSAILGLQAVGLLLIGRGRRLGYGLHVAIGLFWPIASGVAQLPAILSGAVYRSGFISVFYVVGIMIVGLTLLVLAVIAARKSH